MINTGKKTTKNTLLVEKTDASNDMVQKDATKPKRKMTTIMIIILIGVLTKRNHLTEM